MAQNDKIICQRCGKKMAPINFYTYRDGTKCQMCKACLTAHIDNFDPSTFEWILQKFDVPYLPWQWNVIRDRAFAKDPKKMNGMSVIGKYLAKMKGLHQYSKDHYADTQRLIKQRQQEMARQTQLEKQELEKFQAQLKVKLSEGKISLAQYQTLMSTESQHDEYENQNSHGNVITGQQYDTFSNVANPFQQQNFLSQQEVDPGAQLSKEDKLYLALKWGRLYRPAQWVALQQLYNQFMSSFDIQGAARIDTLKMICKTSLKMNQAIDQNDIDTYQKLSRVYDSMMKAAKFTQAQNKDKQGFSIDSASALVDFVQAHAGQIPKYECKQPQDLVDKIILDLKEYNKNLIYQDKALAQEIEKYLQEKRISEQMKREKQQARLAGEEVIIKDQDYIDFKEKQNEMVQHDKNLNDQSLQEEYLKRRVTH